jgi:acetoin utilization deacetylase AcuC-like enzyme
MLLLSSLQPATARPLTATRRYNKHKLAAKARTAAAHGLVYSVSHAEQHDKPGHPEAAARIAAIEQALAQQHFKNQLKMVSGKSMDVQAVMRSLELVHPAGYLQRLQEICGSLQVIQAATSSTKHNPAT